MPGIQADMMVVAAGRKKHCRISYAFCHLKSQQVPVKFKSPLKLSDLQVYMTDPGFDR
jgi:hypothetical protein